MKDKSDRLGEFKELSTDNKRAIVKYMEFLKVKQDVRDMAKRGGRRNDKKRS